MPEAWRDAAGKVCDDFELTVPSSDARGTRDSEPHGRAAVVGGIYGAVDAETGAPPAQN